MLAIIFWIIQKTYRLHVTCWNESGRKLPTAFNSQQLLRWLRPKRYIFSFFLHTKNTKKYVHIDTNLKSMSTLDSMYETYVRNVRNLELFGTSKVEFWGAKSRTFWTCPQKSGNLEILRNPEKSQKSIKSQKSRKSAKSRVFGVPKATIRDLLKSLSGHKISTFRDFPQKSGFLEILVRTWNFRISQVPKKVQNFRLFGTSKKSKKCAVCRGNDASQMAAYFAPWRQKKRTFFDFFEGKGKKCTFFGNFAGFCD